MLLIAGDAIAADFLTTKRNPSLEMRTTEFVSSSAISLVVYGCWNISVWYRWISRLKGCEWCVLLVTREKLKVKVKVKWVGSIAAAKPLSGANRYSPCSTMRGGGRAHQWE